jgi:hypothetical protein
MPQVPRNRRSEIANPAPDCFVGNIQSRLGQQVFNVPVAQREPQIRLHGLLNDGQRELVTGILYQRHPGRLASSLVERHGFRDSALRLEP